MKRIGTSTIGILLGFSMTLGLAGVARADLKPSQRTTLISKAAGAKQYLADIGSINAVTNTVGANLNAATTSAQIHASARLLEATMQQFDSVLRHQQWPSAVRGDMASLLRADGIVENDLASLHGATIQGSSSIESTLRRDDDAVSSAANAVRSDLGLPPPLY